MELKERLIRQIVKDTKIDTQIVEKVISFVGKKTHEALRLYNSVELSGFGTFKVSPSKLKRRKRNLTLKIQDIENLLSDETISDKLRESRTLRLKEYKRQLLMINQRENV